jgi:fused signal recognition particle receptor
VSNKFFSGLFGKKNNQEEKRETDASSNATETAGGPTVSAPRDAAPIAQATPDAALQINHPSPGGASDDTPKPKKGWLSRLTAGLSKSSEKLTSGVTSIFTKRKLDDETLEELQDLLIISDLGVAAAMRITGALAKDKFDKEITDEEVRIVLASEVSSTLTPLEKPLLIDSASTPHVILMIGVNGAGKTTTIGKLAQKFKAEGKSVMLAAGDTFRAAAIEQLTVWGERTGAPVIARDVGSDAAGLAFDAFKEAQAAGTDILIIDTAGRLQNKSALMDELAKIVRVLKKLDETAPHDVVLVLDATVGQNAISQAQAFSDIAGVTGLVMTKLDGTARGGVLVALADKFALPIHFIGVGESVDDLQPFHADSFARALAGLDKHPV